jgi:hypothetical protein
MRKSKSEIDKIYIDSILEYWMYEVYKRIEGRSINPESLEILLFPKVEDLMGRFIIDFKINVNLSSLEKKRDDSISLILDEGDKKEYYLEVAYRMNNRSFHSFIINEEDLKESIKIKNPL